VSAAAAAQAASNAASAALLQSGLPLYEAALQLPPSSIPPVLPLSATPFSGPSRHAAYVLLAEFDILKGSQVKYQYPKPTNIKNKSAHTHTMENPAHSGTMCHPRGRHIISRLCNSSVSLMCLDVSAPAPLPQFACRVHAP